ncbi:hypothetical protein KUTeg_021985 [Tegillarca granosa]|uniref:G8 domain-containing protein n=1 Tax=Tegillarca granosa TaxID=220873 RepID=A0ABQ9E7T9_TEGGR|nr:hypothetical protein KUTeg_021985 [Tegillarca granosa]
MYSRENKEQCNIVAERKSPVGNMNYFQMEIFSVFLLLLIVPVFGKLLCPHEDKDLKPWSEPSSWPNKQVPGNQASVTIVGNILLDVSPPSLHSITVSPGGRLVWSPKANIVLKVKFIHIKGRSRGEYNIPGYGEKFIGVDYGGTLEIHGEEKLSWTKLNKTLPKIKLGDGVLYHHKESDRWAVDEWFQGLAIYIVNPESGAVEDFRVFYLSGQDKWRTDDGRKTIGPFLKSIPNGKVIMMSTQISLKFSENLDEIYDLIELVSFEKITGDSQIRKVNNSDAFGILQQRLKNWCKYQKNKKIVAKVSLNDKDNNLKFTAESHIHDINWKTFVDFWIVESSRAYPILDVIDDVSTWQEGDKVVLTSTDYDYEQAETATVIKCHQCSTKQVKIDLEPKYTHWGEIISNVDMRGEVALLTRNIVIEGEVQDHCPMHNGNCNLFNYDTFGGHIKFSRGFKDVHIEGAELRNMGKQTEKGNYPFHFHMCTNVADERYPHSAYLKDNSIHNSFSRCVTIHGTHGVKVIDNVCYKTLGHAYFLEDGGEKNTLLDGNIGIATMKGSLTPSDESPATFWITNPLTILKNNVAAGSDHTGFWFLFPEEPIGDSRKLHFMEKNEATHTAITEFYNNVAHSNKANGLNIDQKLLEDESSGLINKYDPTEHPSDEKSKPKKVIIKRLTVYKNNIQNAWIRGGLIEVTKSSFADSARGLIFARSIGREQFLTDSVILGETENIGEPTKYFNKEKSTWESLNRAFSIPWDIHHPVLGFIFYDGPIYAHNVWFNAFKTNDLYKMAAIGFKRENKFYNSAVSATSGLQFGFNDGPASGTRIYDGNSTEHGFADMDGDKGATFRDLDGSATSVPGLQVVKPGPFYTTEACAYRRNWNMALCPYKFGKLHVKIDSQEDKGTTMPLMVRDDIPKFSENLTAENSAQFMAILGGTHSYTLHWTHQIPKSFDVFGEGVERGYPVRIGVCLPKNAVFDLYSWSPLWQPTLDKWRRVDSIDQLDSDLKGGAYFWDKNAGLLFIKLLSFKERTPDIKTDCNGLCPMVRIKIISGNRKAGDCRTSAYPKYTRKSVIVGKRRIKAEWGAGATRPFLSRLPVDGAFGEWMEWSECSKECGGGTRTRRRLCNNPIPVNGGTDCVGIRSQTRQCNRHLCPINGGFSEWSPWSKCVVVRDCQGYQQRLRSCNNPKPRFGGLYCEGTLQEMRHCTDCGR